MKAGMNGRIRRFVLLTIAAAGMAGCGPKISQGDDAYTILLKSFTGPGHVTQSKRYKENTEGIAGWKGLYVVHRDQHSDLCWGKYPSIEAAQPDLKKAKALRSDLNLPVYQRPMVIHVPGKHVGPLKWDISAAAEKGAYYTVLIATFYNVPEATIGRSHKRYVGRKKFAVDLCRKLRKEGYEAYYDHGPVQSNVMIGAFPESAVRTVYQKRIAMHKVVDPQARRILANPRFRFLAVNNRRKQIVRKDPRTGKTTARDELSMLIRIPPRKDANDDPTSHYRPGYAEPRQTPGDPAGAQPAVGPRERR